MKTCAHPECTNPPHNRDGKYCSRECDISHRRMVTDEIYSTQLVVRCQECGGPVKRHRGHGYGRYLEKTSCCRSCAAVIASRTRLGTRVDKRHCAICAKQFEPQHADTRTCSKACGATLRRERSREQRHHNPDSSAYRLPDYVLDSERRRAEKLYAEYAKQGQSYGATR